MQLIYLDSAAAAPPCPEALDACGAAALLGNPSSLHAAGAAAAQCLKDARQTVAAALNCAPDELVFTSGGTESDALALLGSLHGHPAPHIVVTALEHPAVAQQAALLKSRGLPVATVPPNKDGGVDAETVAAQVRENTLLVSCTTVCNETGAALPIADIVRAVKAANPKTLVHTDAAQGFLRMDCDVKQTGVDLLSLSAHKIGGVRGAGALYVRRGVKLKPLYNGGGQETGLRHGSEPLPAIAALAAAVAAWRPEYNPHMRALTDYARQQLEQRGLYIVTPPPPLSIVHCQLSIANAPHILTFAPPDIPAQVTVRALSDRGVCISAGSACGRGRTPEALKAMKLPPGVPGRAVRMSVHPGSAREDVDALLRALPNTLEFTPPL